MSELVTYRYDKQGYGEITLNRPEKMNAISKAMTVSFNEALETAKQQSIKFLIITASGNRMFCAGGDLTDLHGDLDTEEAFSVLYPMKEVLYKIVSFPVPTICLLNGDAMGGGCEIATACDFRIAKSQTRFGFVQAKLGITPGWGGGRLLYEKVASAFAFQWLLEAKIHEAEYLQTKGWIHDIVSEDKWNDRASLLKPYLTRSIEQMNVLKNQYLRHISILSLSAQMDDDVKNCANLWETAEHKEAVKQFFSRK